MEDMDVDAPLLLDFDLDLSERGEFHRWSELPRVLKITILRYVPFPTLRNFMFLSKECFALVSEAKPQAGTVRLREQAYREEIFNIPGEKGRMDLDVCWMPPDRQLLRSALKKYRLSFVGDDNGGCFVERWWKKRGRRTAVKGPHYNQDSCTTAMRVLFRFAEVFDILTLEIQLRSLTPAIERALSIESSDTVIASNTLDIRTEDKRLPSAFLRFLRPQSSIRVFSDSDRDTIFLNAAFFDSSVLRAARDLYIDVKAAITDNQLIKLKAHVMRIRSPYLSAWSINKLILQWLEGQRRITFLSIQALKTLPRREVLQNIDPSIIITGAEASDGRGYSPDLYILIRSNHGDLILYLDTDYCNLFDPFQVGN